MRKRAVCCIITPMKYRLICADIDGTLVTGDNRLLAGTADAVRRAVKAGAHFALVSARPPVGMTYLLERMGLSDQYIIAFGGACIMRIGEPPLYEETMPFSWVDELHGKSEEYPLSLSVYSGQELFVERINARVLKEQTIARAVPQLLNWDDIRRRAGDPTKLLYLDEPEKLVEFENWAVAEFRGRLNIYRSKPDYLEVCAPRSTKMGSIRLLAGKLGVKDSEIMAIGDNYNDISMLEEAGLGVAMANAPDEVKRRAGAVTLSNEEDGVGEAIRRFVLE